MKRRFLEGIIQRAAFKKRFFTRKAMLADGRFVCEWEDRWPCLSDNTGTTQFDAHYLYHTAWAARILVETSPVKHTDIGSCLRFVTLVSAFVPVDFYDWRPASIHLRNLQCLQGDITDLPFQENSIPSLSCMHVVEHIGLERYGDTFDPQGDVKGMCELERVLTPGGNLLFVVPVGGVSRIQYNAHRIYRFHDIINQFSKLSLKEYALITDAGEFIEQATGKHSDEQHYGCGCFLFTK